MRVDPTPIVLRLQDRRERSAGADAPKDRRKAPRSGDRRARHALQPWLSSTFAAQVLGQILPEAASPDEAARAYLQPEARTPLRPRHVRSV
jgi:hypothetical protein